MQEVEQIVTVSGVVCGNFVFDELCRHHGAVPVYCYETPNADVGPLRAGIVRGVLDDLVFAYRLEFQYVEQTDDYFYVSGKKPLN